MKNLRTLLEEREAIVSRPINITDLARALRAEKGRLEKAGLDSQMGCSRNYIYGCINGEPCSVNTIKAIARAISSFPLKAKARVCSECDAGEYLVLCDCQREYVEVKPKDL